MDTATKKLMKVQPAVLGSNRSSSKFCILYYMNDTSIQLKCQELELFMTRINLTVAKMSSIDSLSSFKPGPDPNTEILAENFTLCWI